MALSIGSKRKRRKRQGRSEATRSASKQQLLHWLRPARGALAAAALCLTWAPLARAELVSWNAPPSCPPPLEATRVAGTDEPGQDEILVGVSVTQSSNGWRAVLTARDQRGNPLGERVLEQNTCAELNRVVVVSLAVLFGAAAPPPLPPSEARDPAAGAQGPSSDPSDPATNDTAANTTPASEAAAIDAASSSTANGDAARGDGAVTTGAVLVEPALAAPTQTAPAGEPARPAPPAEPTAPLPPEDELDDLRFQASVSPDSRLALGRFELLPSVHAALDLTSITSLGIGMAGVAGLNIGALRVGGGWRRTLSAVDVVPEVSYSVLSLSTALCVPLADLGRWLVCLGPHLEMLHGTMANSTAQQAIAWLPGMTLGLTRFGGSPSGVLGWFAALEVLVRRGADFELTSPTTTVFEYPSVGLVLSLGPDFRF